MLPMEVMKPSGFYCEDKTFTIYDVNGFMFYSRKSKERGTHFNLPAGKFTTDSPNIVPRSFRIYRTPALPSKERNLPTPSKVEFKIYDTPNKCIVVREKGIWLIVMSPSLANGQRISKDLAIAHEFGHKYYGGANPVTDFDKYIASEMKCDHYAIDYLLRNGYNPSQLNNAEKLTLSNSAGSEKRKKYIHEILKRVK